MTFIQTKQKIINKNFFWNYLHKHHYTSTGHSKGLIMNEENHT